MKKNGKFKILVPTDFSEIADIAVSEAIVLMKSLDGEIILMHVAERSVSDYAVFPEFQTAVLSEFDQRIADEKLEKEIIEKTTKKYGIVPYVVITSGNVASEIIEYSEKKKIDFIVMGTHGASGYKELFIGSNAQHVVAMSEIPVLTIHQEKNYTGFRNILIPIDNSVHSREKVNFAILIGNLFKSQIHLVGLFDSDNEQDLNKFKIKLESIENMLQEEGLSFKYEIVRGKNLSKIALDYAVKNNCDLIVINTGHESKLGGLLPAAFTHQIINHSNIPVLSIKHSESHYSIETPGYGIS